MSSAKVICESIMQRQNYWIGIIEAKTKDNQTAQDVFQEAILTILENIHIGKLDPDKIMYTDISINYYYFYKVLRSKMYDFLNQRAKFEEMHTRLTSDFDVADTESEEATHIDLSNLVDGMNTEMDVLFMNKCDKRTLHQIAKELETNYTKIWRLKDKAIKTIRNKYEETKKERHYSLN